MLSLTGGGMRNRLGASAVEKVNTTPNQSSNSLFKNVVNYWWPNPDSLHKKTDGGGLFHSTDYKSEVDLENQSDLNETESSLFHYESNSHSGYPPYIKGHKSNEEIFEAQPLLEKSRDKKVDLESQLYPKTKLNPLEIKDLFVEVMSYLEYRRISCSTRNFKINI